MSITFLNFKCTGCEYSETSLITVGRFVWVHEGRMFNFFPKIGVCEDCSKIVPIESIPDHTLFQRAKALHPDVKGKISLLMEQDEVYKFAIQKEFDVLEAVLKANRKEVCLNCNGTDHNFFDLQTIRAGYKTYDTEKISLDQQHPKCGGSFTIESSGHTRISIMPKTHYFDIKGKFLATLNGSEGHTF